MKIDDSAHPHFLNMCAIIHIYVQPRNRALFRDAMNFYIFIISIKKFSNWQGNDFRPIGSLRS